MSGRDEEMGGQTHRENDRDSVCLCIRREIEARSLLDRKKPFYDLANKLAGTRFRYSKKEAYSEYEIG